MVSRGQRRMARSDVVARGLLAVVFTLALVVTATHPRLRMMRLTPGNLWKNHS